jgi:hypothetical protein
LFITCEKILHNKFKLLVDQYHLCAVRKVCSSNKIRWNNNVRPILLHYVGIIFLLWGDGVNLQSGGMLIICRRWRVPTGVLSAVLLYTIKLYLWTCKVETHKKWSINWLNSYWRRIYSTNLRKSTLTRRAYWVHLVNHNQNATRKNHPRRRLNRNNSLINSNRRKSWNNQMNNPVNRKSILDGFSESACSNNSQKVSPIFIQINITYSKEYITSWSQQK